ncbi:MAG: thermonuclease family protein [Roseibium sp.]
MKLRSIIVPIVVLTVFGGAVAWLIFAKPPTASTPSLSAETSPAVLAVPDQPKAIEKGSLPPESGSSVAAPLPDNIRDVSPDGVSAPTVTSDLKRIEPSKRYLELKNPPIEPIPDGPLEFVRVQVLDAGHLKSGQLTIKLAHIEHLALDDTCASTLGDTWPCGTRARTFLRGLVRQLKVTCEKVEELGPQKVLATCSRGPIDLSTRLVRYGWATPTDNAPEPFQELAQSAREREFGKWQNEWFTDDSDLPAWAETDNSLLPDLEDLVPEVVDWSLRSEPLFEEEELPLAPQIGVEIQ